MVLVFHVISQDHWMSHVILQVRAHQGKPLSCQVWWPKALWQWKYVFDLSRDLARPRDQRVIYFMSRSQSRQIEILPSFVVISTLEDKVVKASYDFMGGYPSR